MNKIKEIWLQKPLWLKIIIVGVIGILIPELLERAGFELAFLLFESSIMNGTFQIGGLVISSGYLNSLCIWPVLILFLVVIKPLRTVLYSLSTKCKGNRPGMFLLGALTGLGLNSIVALCAILHGDIKLVYNDFNLIYLLILLIAVFIQSGLEEMIYRGLILRVSAMYFPYPIVIIGVNSLLFAYGHFNNGGINIFGALFTAASGVFMSILVYYADSMWAAIGFHMLWNFSQSIVWGLLNSGSAAPYTVFKLADGAEIKNSIFYSAEYGIEGAAISSVLIIILIVLFMHFKPRRGTDWDAIS